MIDRDHDLSLVRQAKVLNISRGAVYYKPRPVSPEDLAIMRRIDELHLEYHFAGSRMMRDFLNRAGVSIGRRHVATLMKRMGLEAHSARRNAQARPHQVAASSFQVTGLHRGETPLHRSQAEVAPSRRRTKRRAPDWPRPAGRMTEMYGG